MTASDAATPDGRDDPEPWVHQFSMFPDTRSAKPLCSGCRYEPRDHQRLRNAIANVLVNGSNYPPKVTPRILRQDMTPLIDTVLAAVVATEGTRS